MDTMTLTLSYGELNALLRVLNEAMSASLADECEEEGNEVLHSAACAKTDFLMRIASRVRQAAQTLSMRADHYPPGKVRPPLSWQSAPAQTVSAA